MDMYRQVAFEIAGTILPFLLTGCVPQRITYSYEKINLKSITKATHKQVILDCTDKPGLWDDGTPRPQWADVIGCTWRHKNGACDIEIEDSCRGAKALPHELAHCMGIKSPDEEGYEW